MQVNVSYQGNLKFQATARNHTILSDQPLDNGGDDAGMTPPEWLLASLGSCVGIYAVKYCQSRGLDATELKIQVSAQKAAAPTRLDDIKIHVSLPIALEPHHQQGLQKAVEACLIHNTLINPPKITTQINSLVTRH